VTARSPGVAYWDTSAIVAVLFSDDHSADASRLARSAGTHLISSLAWAEAHAVIARIERDQVLAATLADASRDLLSGGPWRRINVAPAWTAVETLARAWPLRGANLWHLAAAKTLQADLPELTIVTFDERLAAAARSEGL
jgi:predicted nucleic acid-binding protein